MKAIIQKPIKHICSEELDFDLRNDILGKDWSEENDFEEIYMGRTNQVNNPIKIDTLRYYLDQLEQLGANYVSIDYHTDHIEYELDGIEARLATQQEIDEHFAKDKETHIKQIKSKIDEYQKLLNQFKNKLKELSGE